MIHYFPIISIQLPLSKFKIILISYPGALSCKLSIPNSSKQSSTARILTPQGVALCFPCSKQSSKADRANGDRSHEKSSKTSEKGGLLLWLQRRVSRQKATKGHQGSISQEISSHVCALLHSFLLHFTFRMLVNLHPLPSL